jgi:hypothetical protein
VTFLEVVHLFPRPRRPASTAARAGGGRPGHGTSCSWGDLELDPAGLCSDSRTVRTAPASWAAVTIAVSTVCTGRRAEAAGWSGPVRAGVRSAVTKSRMWPTMTTLASAALTVVTSERMDIRSMTVVLSACGGRVRPGSRLTLSTLETNSPVRPVPPTPVGRAFALLTAAARNEPTRQPRQHKLSNRTPPDTGRRSSQAAQR